MQDVYEGSTGKLWQRLREERLVIEQGGSQVIQCQKQPQFA